MNMKKIYIVLALLLTITRAYADEGMWLINLISQYNMSQMENYGLKLSASDIYDLNKSSIKDAVVALDHGSCTASFVSNRGLIMTNNHCAYDDVQKLSSLDHDYLKDGFWAKSLNEEITIPGKSISILIKVEDVTDLVNAKIKIEVDKGNKSIFMMRKIFKHVEKSKVKESGYEVCVNSTFRGKQYFAYYYQTFNDIRLVSSPPSCLGMFGGDTDNWNWPQNKADFAIYRVYASADGKPNKYSKDNKPYKPKYVLPISTKGVKNGDFSMVIGYPGSTHRYKSSFAIEEKINVKNLSVITVRTEKLAAIKKAMNESDDIRIKYASKYFNSSNYWKYAIGENKCLKDYDVINKRKTLENQLRQYSKHEKKYIGVLDSLKKYYTIRANFRKSEEFFRESIFGCSDMLLFAMHLKGLKMILVKKKPQEAKVKTLKRNLKTFYKDYDLELDKKITSIGLRNYFENTDKKHIPSIISKMLKDHNDNYDDLAYYLLENSILHDANRLNNFLNHINLEVLLKDPAFVIVDAITKAIHKNRLTSRKYDKKIRTYATKYTHGILEMQKDKQLAPDANSTMRITYGTLGGYSPKDGVFYKCQSTTDGYLQKNKIDNPEFRLDADIKEMLEKKDFGRYKAKDGKLYTGFIANCDITGGNSGSPVLNAKGKMIGLAYDGNWESMAGDIYFNPEMNKTVCVDIRFILWVIDKYANQKYIMKELLN